MSDNNLATNLKELRKLNNISQRELARKFHVSRSAVSGWETGRNTPDIEVLNSLCIFYAISIEDILSPKITTAPKIKTNHLIIVWIILGVLFIERITQLSSMFGLIWIDFLMLILFFNLLLSRLVSLRKINMALGDKMFIGMLTGFGILSLVSGIFQPFNLGFGLSTTTQFCGAFSLAYVLCPHILKLVKRGKS